ncbi:conserved hypothetical protein [Culex quinquefasciatus]|uniref:K Homology domain-containing protein n=1 Tax=Culex quinquefasciatus TaxID=7176 RepID=B0X7W6_CULQU|nr:conserved hypothetical protein [Culex quinquefasciatus]|eukprot:XP_001865738.1 conserved hypothetical protein [Culex quinquefasciatus]
MTGKSGAKINISDGSCPERIVTVSGSRSAIYKAFTLITKKFEEWCSQFQDNTNAQGKTQIPIRLIVPASQCGSLIGKGGSKIKEIREITGCSIQVASEMLPNSTERAVTLSGSADSITQCIYHICCVMLEIFHSVPVFFNPILHTHFWTRPSPIWTKLGGNAHLSIVNRNPKFGAGWTIPLFLAPPSF